MLDKPPEIQALVHQWFEGLRESNNAAKKSIEHQQQIFQLKEKHRHLVNELTDRMISDQRVEEITTQIKTLNEEIIFHATQQRKYSIIRFQKAEEIKQINP